MRNLRHGFFLEYLNRSNSRMVSGTGSPFGRTSLQTMSYVEDDHILPVVEPYATF